jgi:signal transduction histidine kinase
MRNQLKEIMQTATILIVDDDAGLLTALTEMLRLRLSELSVDTAASPAEALEKITQLDYDAIITDINLPGLSGLSLLGRIKATRPNTPTLIMTAYDDHAFVVQALRGGAYDFIQKPIDLDYFVVSLQRAIQTHQLHRQVSEQQMALERHAQELEQAVQRAVAETQEVQRQLAFLASASTLLGSSLDYEATLSLVVRLALRVGADYVILDTLDENTQTLTPARIVHANRNDESAVQQMRAYYQEHNAVAYPVWRVLDTGQSMLQGYITPASLREMALDENHLALLQQVNPQSMVTVLLRSPERTLGTLTLARTQADRPFGESDLALIEDLARRSALALDNSRLYAEAQQALQVRDNFLSLASHELKTPMTAVLGTLQLLTRYFEKTEDLNPKVNRNLQILSRQSYRLNQLVSSLLDISRLEIGQFSIEKKPLDVVALGQRLVSEMEPTLTQHQIEFKTDSEHLCVLGDELRLEQVLQNLLQNAVKYSPGGGTILLQTRRMGQQVEIDIVDSGIGIPPESIPHLFDRFYRANNSKTQHIAGVGLGLYVVKEITSLHGGTIEVKSNPEQGSTFTIRLPLLDLETPSASETVLNQEL